MDYLDILNPQYLFSFVSLCLIILFKLNFYDKTIEKSGCNS